MKFCLGSKVCAKEALAFLMPRLLESPVSMFNITTLASLSEVSTAGSCGGYIFKLLITVQVLRGAQGFARFSRQVATILIEVCLQATPH